MTSANKKKKLITVIFLLSITRIGDGLTTYLVTPNLEGEKNPLVTVFEFGWISLILSGFFLVMLVSFLYHYYLHYEESVNPPEQLKDMKSYISYYYFGDKDSFPKLFYAFPKNKQALLASIGFVLSHSLIAYSFLLIFHNLLIYYSDAYNYFMVVYNGWILMYAVLLPVGYYFFLLFFRQKYMSYLRFSVQHLHHANPTISQRNH